MSAPLSLERLSEIRAREQALPHGSWKWQAQDTTGWSATFKRTIYVLGNSLTKTGIAFVFGADSANAEFVAHARQDIPALLDEVERLTEAHRRAWELLSECRVAFFAALHDAPGLDGGRGEALLRSIDAVREVVAEGCP